MYQGTALQAARPRSGAWASFRRMARAALAPYPSAYFFFFRLFAAGKGYNGALCRETELVIEGFPRSANSWSVVAFREAQGREVRLAHHRHAEAQVLAAARRGLPVVVLVRRPADAIRSLKLRNPEIDQNDALRRWTRFYEAVVKVSDKVVIATFEQATGDFGKVIDRINARFACDFARCEASEEFREHVFAAMERDNADNPAFAARPSPERSRALQALALDLAPQALARANAFYDRLAALAN